ncbi:MAG: ATP-binding cassette domain-containing protein [bacterium]|nr:ATP-binding cassette domain-containing protein [bacterium]
MIELKQLSIARGNKEICADLSVVISKGACCLVTGPNGSGKSTLLQALLGIVKPSSGQILIDDYDVQQLSRADKQILIQSTGIALQEFSLPSFGTVRHFLQEAGCAASATAELLSFLEFQSQAEAQLDQLSTSEKKRLYLGSSLARQPRLVMWDEPFSELDERWKGKFLKVLEELKKAGTTIIITSFSASAFDRLQPDAILSLE